MSNPILEAAAGTPLPDVVICGNITRDVTPDGWTPGGTAVYAAAVARGLGRRVGVVTATPADVVTAGLPPAIVVARVDVPEATSFENIYTADGRIQYLRAAGSSIPPDAMPADWTGARVVLLGPVYHEVTLALAERFDGTIGVCAQGFLRRTDADGRVALMAPDAWNALPILQRARVLFLSEEDLAGAPGRAVPPAWLAAVPVVVLTAGRRGASVHAEGRWTTVPTLPVEEIDPTGAGDSFAAAFMIAEDAGADPTEAARFAAAVASITVETRGPATPNRDEAIERQRMIERIDTAETHPTFDGTRR
jgi:sugar/nucleoside kinase (ribokinase family)